MTELDQADLPFPRDNDTDSNRVSRTASPESGVAYDSDNLLKNEAGTIAGDCSMLRALQDFRDWKE